jgi:tetratricopeptide (TPR) repeat protein
VELARAYPDFYHESPHNIFLDALVSQGVLGLVALVLICGLGFYAAWQLRSSKPGGALACGFFASLVSQQFTVFTLPTALYFYLTLALVVCSTGIPACVAVSRPAWAPRAMSLLFSIPALCLALSLWVSDRDLELVRRDLDQGQPQEAAVLYQRARKWAPPGVSSDLWYSRAMAQAAKQSPLKLGVLAWQQSLEAGIRATQSAEDRPNAWYSLAALYASQNDVAHTEASLRSAAGIAPNWFKPHWMLAQVLRAEGRLPEAAAEADRAADLDGGKHREVARTQRELRGKQ